MKPSFLFSSLALLSLLSVNTVHAQNTSAADYYDQRFGAISSSGEIVVRRPVPSLRPKANLFDAKTQFAMGVDFETGRNQKRDLKEAIFWYSKSAEQGNPFALMALAKMYGQGIGVEKNLEKACDYYESAAGLGVHEAQYNVGLMYAAGDGRQQDFEKAALWYEKAAQSGLAKAQYNLALLYAYGQGIPTDLLQAHKWLSIAKRDSNSKEQAEKSLQILEQHLSPEQVSNAIKLSAQWQGTTLP